MLTLPGGILIAASAAHRFFAWYGWPALVALGTLGLASVTYFLVRATYALATQTAAEARAQWRPILLVEERVERSRANFTFTASGVEYRDGGLSIVAANVGTGAALAVSAELDGFDKPGPGFGVPRGTPPSSGAMGSRRTTTIAPSDVVTFEWQELGGPHDAYSGGFHYTDVAGAPYSTSFFARRFEERIELVSQSVSEINVSELLWWQRVFPPWLVAPLTQRRLRKQYDLPPGGDAG